MEIAVETALRVGYRHIDAATYYQNEHEVGNGWKKSGVPRDQIFVCTSITSTWNILSALTFPCVWQITGKLWNTHHHPEHVEEAVDKSLKDLQTDYFDLYLVCDWQESDDRLTF